MNHGNIIVNSIFLFLIIGILLRRNCLGKNKQIVCCPNACMNKKKEQTIEPQEKENLPEIDSAQTTQEGDGQNAQYY